MELVAKFSWNLRIVQVSLRSIQVKEGKFLRTVFQWSDIHIQQNENMSCVVNHRVYFIGDIEVQVGHRRIRHVVLVGEEAPTRWRLLNGRNEPYGSRPRHHRNTIDHVVNGVLKRGNSNG